MIKNTLTRMSSSNKIYFHMVEIASNITIKGTFEIMKISQAFFIKVKKASNNIICFFKKKIISKVNFNIIKNKPSKKFSEYKIKTNFNAGVDLQIFKYIIYCLDKLFHSKKLDNMRKKTLLTEDEIWGVDSKNIIIQDDKTAEDNSINLCKQFDNKQIAYLLIYPNLHGLSQHVAMFFGESIDHSEDALNVHKYASWQPNYNGKSCDSLLSDVHYHGLPEVIPLSGLNIELMKKTWLQLSKSDIKYNFTRENCSSIVNYIIDIGLGIDSKIEDIPFLYPPEKLRKRGLSLMGNENQQNEISKPLTTRRLFIKTHKQLMDEAKEQEQQQAKFPQKNKKKLFKK